MKIGGNKGQRSWSIYRGGDGIEELNADDMDGCMGCMDGLNA